MPTIDFQDGCKIVINTDDHAPPHVHVFRNSTWAKIGIGDENAPAYILDPKRMSDRDLRVALRVVDANWSTYLNAWSRYHG